ncbi:hypothetical protein YC2023_121034 [Brassica napus]
MPMYRERDNGLSSESILCVPVPFNHKHDFLLQRTSLANKISLAFLNHDNWETRNENFSRLDTLPTHTTLQYIESLQKNSIFSKGLPQILRKIQKYENTLHHSLTYDDVQRSLEPLLSPFSKKVSILQWSTMVKLILCEKQPADFSILQIKKNRKFKVVIITSIIPKLFQGRRTHGYLRRITKSLQRNCCGDLIAMRSYSTSFREERDNFGRSKFLPISLGSHLFLP